MRSSVIRRRAAHAIAIVCCAAAAASCRLERSIAGEVADYDTHQPIAGVTVSIAQSGWGWSDGSLVWDKSYETRTTSDAAGAFVARYQVGSSAHLHAWIEGFNEFEGWYDAGAHASIRLKRLAPASLPLRLAHLGVAEDGAPVGWNFTEGRAESNAAIADVIPTGSVADVTKALTLSAPGGLRFISTRDLGVEDDSMIYVDAAPDAGYTATLALDFAGPAGVIVIRTRDGGHYAKLSFTPNGLGSETGRGAAKALLLNYVYNPSGGRALPFNRPHLTASK